MNQAEPTGATHYDEPYGIRTYWKTAVYDYGVESGEPFRAWHSWDRTTERWKKESYVRTTHFVAIH